MIHLDSEKGKMRICLIIKLLMASFHWVYVFKLNPPIYAQLYAKISILSIILSNCSLYNRSAASERSPQKMERRSCSRSSIYQIAALHPRLLKWVRAPGAPLF